MSTHERGEDAAGLPDGLMRVADVADYFKVSPVTIRRWTLRGILPYVRIGTGKESRRSIRYRREDVERIAEDLVVRRVDEDRSELDGFGTLVGDANSKE